MCAVVMVISADVKFRDTLDESQVEAFSETSFTITEDEVLIPMYEWFKEEFFESDLDSVYADCKSMKAKLKGNIFLVRKENEDEGTEVTQHHIKLGVKEYNEDECTFRVSATKSDGKKRKTFTEEEKVGLFKEYWESKKKLPPPKEVYKEFRIGTFYATCKKNEQLMKALNEIQKE